QTFRPELGHDAPSLEVWFAALDHRRQTVCTLTPISAHQGTGCPLDCLSPLLRKRPEWVRRSFVVKRRAKPRQNPLQFLHVHPLAELKLNTSILCAPLVP